MATRIVARCPHCRGRFPWDRKLGFPSKCPLPGCDYVAKEVDDKVIPMPMIRHATTNTPDRVYREMEKSSEARAQMAADVAGVPVSEMANLKMTNMRDNVREGETYAMPVSNDVTKQMDALKTRGGQFGFVGSEGAGFATGTATGAIKVGDVTVHGVEPRAGSRAMTNIQRMMGK